jgi:hypothetical protein
MGFAAFWALNGCVSRILRSSAGGEFARLMMDPNNLAFLSLPGPGDDLLEAGGGLTFTQQRRASKPGYSNISRVCQDSAEGFHDKYGTSRPPLNFIPSDECGLIAHELGHQFDGFYGVSGRSLSWENALRAMQGLPPRLSHSTPRHPFAPQR